MAEEQASTIMKPGDVHEKPISVTSMDVDVEKQPPETGEARPSGPARSTSEIVYPPFKQMVPIMVAIMLAAFLIALVRATVAPFSWQPLTTVRIEQSSPPQSPR